MGRFTRKATPAIGSGLLALLGALYCLGALLGFGEALCITTGCSLYQNFSLYGISLWHAGIFTFLVLAALAFTCHISLALNLSRLTVVADCFLLLLMSLTSPCLACMGAAVFLAVVFRSLYHARAQQHSAAPPSRSRLLAVWLLCMTAAVVLAAKEVSAPAPWLGPEDAAARIYFSPHCAACLNAVEAAETSPLPVAYYPVATSLDEVKIILGMEEDLARGMPLAESLRKLRANPPQDLRLSLHSVNTLWQILRNRADVLSLGKGSVPLILLNGVPHLGLQTAAGPAPESPPARPNPDRLSPISPEEPDIPGIFFDFNTSQCNETNDADCVER